MTLAQSHAQKALVPFPTFTVAIPPSPLACTETRSLPPDDIEQLFESRATDFVVSRWQAKGGDCELHDTSMDRGHLTIALYLKRTCMDYWSGQHLIHSGRVAAGSILVSRRGQSARIRLRDSCDVLYLHVNRNAIERYGLPENAPNIPCQSLLVDSAIERLGQALLQSNEPTDTGAIYVHSLCAAITIRVFGLLAAGYQRAKQSAATPLPAWRLRKATEYIDANLAETIKLEHVADAAGLTRMHFAAQFRAATGQRPHDYLLRRRIEKAQELLEKSTTPIAQVALEVGFQTQAHFGSVFKRFAGETPSRWRCQAQNTDDVGRTMAATVL